MESTATSCILQHSKACPPCASTRHRSTLLRSVPLQPSRLEVYCFRRLGSHFYMPRLKAGCTHHRFDINDVGGEAYSPPNRGLLIKHGFFPGHWASTPITGINFLNVPHPFLIDLSRDHNEAIARCEYRPIFVFCLVWTPLS
jgi:hypothetical protein